MNNEKLDIIINDVENSLIDIYKNIDDNCFNNSLKVINAFKNNNINETHFQGTTGYGYGDIGRDKIDAIFANVLGAESAIVRNQFISGSHALTVALFALLRPNDTLLSISGTPYDTLHEVIGIRNNPSSLTSFNIKYEQIDLLNDDFDYEKIKTYLKNNNVKVVAIQRSKGYSTRKSISIVKIKEVAKMIKNIDKNIIIMVDNCYCEFVESISPLEVGANIIVGSLIKNLGGGIAQNGAYIAGDKTLVSLCAERLTLPGEGADVGPSLGANKLFLQGLYLAPSIVRNSLKVAVFTSKLLEKLGFEVEPKYNDYRVDIVQSIIFHNEEKLIKYIEGIQSSSAIDANVLPVPTNMPGYKDKIIMASGSFTQGSSIELSCDGPIKEPFIAYQQGSLTYEYGKLAVINAIKIVLDLQK